MCELFFIQRNYHNITIHFIYDMKVYFLTPVPAILQSITHVYMLQKGRDLCLEILT